MPSILLALSFCKFDRKWGYVSQNCHAINVCKYSGTHCKRLLIWENYLMNEKVQRFVREKVAGSAAEWVSLKWTHQIVAWWKRISVINCSLKFPSCSSFAVLLCVVLIGFTEITCGVRCYSMWVSKSEKNLNYFNSVLTGNFSCEALVWLVGSFSP